MNNIKRRIIEFLNKSNNKFLRSFINKIRSVLINSLGIVEINNKPYPVISSDSIENYFLKNNYTFSLTKLFQNLDKKSIKTLEIILERICNTSKFVYKKNLLKTELEDLLILKNYTPTHLSGKQFNIKFVEKMFPGFSGYEVSVFKFHHGLKLVNNETLEYIKDKDCIDAGSCEGESAIIFNSFYNLNKIYSFETETHKIKLSEKNFKKYFSFVSNVTFVNRGLSNKTKIENNVKFTSIDEFIVENKVNLGLIKFDIEGAEYESILGAKNTIQKYLPVILVSIYHNPKDFFEIKPLIESFIPNEYNFFVRKLNPGYAPVDTYLICIPKKSKGFLKDSEDLDFY